MTRGLLVRSQWRARRNTRRARTNTLAFYSSQPLMAHLPDQALALRRERLVDGLFKHVGENQELEDGDAFKFRRSELLTRRLAGNIVFEGQHVPQVTFALIAEQDGAPWD